jgi:hypothetical protein
MARENQGLHIALIAFVMLTIGLGVTSFLSYRKYEETAKQKDQAQGEANTQTQSAKNAAEENKQLRTWIGWTAAEKLEAMSQQFNDDMNTAKNLGVDVTDNTRTYRAILAPLLAVIQKKNAEAAEALEAKSKEEVRAKSLEGNKEAQIDTYKEGQKKAQDELAEQRAKFDSDRQDIVKEKGDLLAALDKRRKEADKTLAKVQSDLTGVKEKLKDTTDRYNIKVEQIRKITANEDKLVEILDKLPSRAYDVPDGKIHWVNQRNGTVWVNLGQADGLQRQVSFAVFAADTSDVGSAMKKGAIEITDILGDHMAEARILEDKESDPILPGDLVYTPVWSAGKREHFALSIGMDIDGDGRADTEQLKDIVRMGGGEVVCWIANEKDPDKVHIEGKIDTSTSFLVLGRQGFGEKVSQQAAEAHSKMVQAAKDNGVQQIKLDELLKKMHYKNPTPVTTYGPGSNPDQFKPKPREGGQPVSTGTVSPLVPEA